MAALNTTPTTTFQQQDTFYGGRRFRQMRQRVICSDGNRFVALGGNIPAYARVIAATILNTIVPTVSGTVTTITADSIALMMYPASNAAGTALTAPPATVVINQLTIAAPTVTQPVNSSGIMLAQTPGIGTSETNGRYRGAPLIERVNTNRAIAENPYPVAALLALVPAGLSSNVTQAGSTSAITTGYCFGTALTGTGTQAALVDVELYIEIFSDYASY